MSHYTHSFAPSEDWHNKHTRRGWRGVNREEGFWEQKIEFEEENGGQREEGRAWRGAKKNWDEVGGVEGCERRRKRRRRRHDKG